MALKLVTQILDTFLHSTVYSICMLPCIHCTAVQTTLDINDETLLYKSSTTKNGFVDLPKSLPTPLPGPMLSQPIDNPNKSLQY